MELQAVLVLCGVGVAGLAMLLLMTLFSATGTSYEEAIAQQRRATTELLALAESKNKPKKKEKKANKKLAKKEKTKETSATTGSEVESEAPAESGVEDDLIPAAKGHVEFSSELVVEVPKETLPHVKIRKRGKDPKVKPILINKEDPSCVSDPSTVPETTATPAANHFEEMHPKDEFELMHSTLVAERVLDKTEDIEKKDKVTKPAKSGKPAAKPAAPAVEVAKEEVTRERHNSGDAPKEQRKGKKTEKKASADDVVDVVRDEVVPPLNIPQPSELTTEKLLKQALAAAPPAPQLAPASSPPGGKNKKKKTELNVLSLMAGDSSGVNVSELVRVVREAALSRNEIQILTDALLNKHHDPLPEHSEWSEGPNDPMQKLKKQLADKEKSLADEVEASQALHAKLKELRTQLNAERTRAGTAATAARSSEQAMGAVRTELQALQASLQRLADDNKQLNVEKQQLQAQVNANSDTQAQMEMHIKRLTDAEQSLLGQLNSLQKDLAAHALEVPQLRMETCAARDALHLSQQQANELAQQLTDANCALSELELQRLAAINAEQRAAQDLRHANERLAAMTELQNEVQRLTSRAQSTEENLEKMKEESEQQKIQLASELTALKEQLAARDTELAELKQLRAAPAHNGLPASDQAKQSAELAKVESVVETLRDELGDAQKTTRDLREQVTHLQDQLAVYQDKNNELRTKNWKVMEALQSAEKALQTKTARALPAQESQDSLREAIAKAQEVQYNEVASVLREAWPAAAPSAPAGRDWLRAFADNLKEQLLKAQAVEVTPAPPPTSVDTSEVEERLRDLQVQNEKYRRIVYDTEGLLSRLQQHVTLEEQKWAQQLADKQRELEELRQHTVMQMQSKIDALQVELHQAKSSKNDHTFADAERMAEERLMGASITDKHNVDVCNGPLQMGLEEK